MRNCGEIPSGSSLAVQDSSLLYSTCSGQPDPGPGNLELQGNTPVTYFCNILIQTLFLRFNPFAKGDVSLKNCEKSGFFKVQALTRAF